MCVECQLRIAIYFVILQKKEKVFINFERQILSKSFPSLQVKNTFKPNLAVYVLSDYYNIIFL